MIPNMRITSSPIKCEAKKQKGQTLTGAHEATCACAAPNNLATHNAVAILMRKSLASFAELMPPSTSTPKAPR
jgi:hypothetical protein